MVSQGAATKKFGDARPGFTVQARREHLLVLGFLANYSPEVDYSGQQRQDSPKRWRAASGGQLAYRRKPYIPKPGGVGKERLYRTGPTAREIMAATGIKSPYTLSLRKAQLAAMGLVTYIPNKSRSLAITEAGKLYLSQASTPQNPAKAPPLSAVP